MKLLAVDTSTTSCSVALFEDDRLLMEITDTTGETHSRQLLSAIHRMVDRCGCRIKDVGRIAVTRGPGTFTGLRIGIGTVKGLAAATGASVVGVASLAALAYPLRWSERPVVAMLDARRGEIYHAQYRCGGDEPEAVTPVDVGSPEAVAAVLPEEAVLVGSGAVLYRRAFEAHCPGLRFADPIQNVIRAASVGMLGMARFLRQDIDSAEALVPDYIRKSDAQIQMSGTC